MMIIFSLLLLVTSSQLSVMFPICFPIHFASQLNKSFSYAGGFVRAQQRWEAEIVTGHLFRTIQVVLKLHLMEQDLRNRFLRIHLLVVHATAP